MATTSLISKSTNGLGTARTVAPKSTDAATQAFAKAENRIQKQRDTTSVQLSTQGRLQAAVADTQTSARALSDVKATDGADKLRNAAGSFVKTFNKAATVAREVTSASNALADNSRARIAGNELRRSVSSDTTTTNALRDIGISQQKDGSLVIDQKKFDTALQSDSTRVRDTLARAGQQVDNSASRQLATNGNIGGAINTLDTRAKELETRQLEQQAQANAAQQTLTAQTNRINNLQVTAGIASYERIFSF